MDTYLLYFLFGGTSFAILICIVYYIVKKVIKIQRKKFIPKKATKFTCLDGHVTRSKGEMIIDNMLTHLNLHHEYENTIKVSGAPIKYDWFLPEYDVYIEYWGYFGKDYINRKNEKKQLYRKGKLKLISIEDVMLEDIYKNLKIELEKFIPSEKLERNEKFCPNCGQSLDKRFF